MGEEGSINDPRRTVNIRNFFIVLEQPLLNYITFPVKNLIGNSLITHVISS